MTALMLLSLIPAQVKAANEPATVAVTADNGNESADEAAQLARLEEINAMDMSTLSRAEKKELRNEVSAIKSNQDGRGRRHHDRHAGRNFDGRHGGGSVFVVGGGGILILLLLIVLL